MFNLCKTINPQIASYFAVSRTRCGSFFLKEWWNLIPKWPFSYQSINFLHLWAELYLVIVIVIPPWTKRLEEATPKIFGVISTMTSSSLFQDSSLRTLLQSFQGEPPFLKVYPIILPFLILISSLHGTSLLLFLRYIIFKRNISA